MKPSKLFVALLVLLAVTSVLSSPSLSAAAGPSQDTHGEFRQQFGEAMKLNSTKEMARLVKAKTDEAVAYVIETAEAISNQTSPELEARMAALRAAWRESMDTAFCDQMYEYFSLLERQAKEERGRLKRTYDKASDKFRANFNGAKDGPTFALLSIEFEGMAQQFERLGDKYHASQSWLLFGSCNRDDLRPDGDLYKTYQGYKRCIDLRDAIGLKDRWYIETKNYADALARKGYADSKPAPEGPTPEGPPGPAGAPAGPAEPAASGAAISAPMAFEPFTELLELERPMYCADTEYPLWTAFNLQAKGSSARITSMEKLSPTVLRDGASTVALDTNNDGQGDRPIPVTGNWEPVQFEIGEGDEKRPWAMLATVGAEKDLYQGIEISLMPQGDYFTLYFVPAASMLGAIGDVQVRVFDDNADGIYGSPPKFWHHTGMSEGHDQPELDSILVTGEERARPWSEYQKIGETWFKLASAKGGNVLEATPVELEVGTLELKYGGEPPAWIVVRGKGKFENSYFDLTGGKTEVPTGTYELFYGELRKGKKRATAKAVIVPGADTPTWSVETGATAVVELGAPYGFDFKVERSGEHVTVVGQSVVVVGKAGERYERTWNCVPRPEASWRKAGTKKGSKGEQLELVLDQFAITKHGWRAAWSPLDVTMTLKGSPDKIEVQLFEKKNKLFGQVESVWIPE